MPLIFRYPYRLKVCLALSLRVGRSSFCAMASLVPESFLRGMSLCVRASVHHLCVSACLYRKHKHHYQYHHCLQLTCTDICVYVCVYIYIYIYRERERVDRCVCVSVYLCVSSNLRIHVPARLRTPSIYVCVFVSARPRAPVQPCVS